MLKKKYLTIIATHIIIVCMIGTAYAGDCNCRGCCSGHGGVICVNGFTMCADGTSLSSTCINKGCVAEDCPGCGGITTTTMRSTTTTMRPTTTTMRPTTTTTTIPVVATCSLIASDSLKSLLGTAWDFTYSIYTDTVTFETEIKTGDDGNLLLMYHDQAGNVGGVFYTEFSSEMGGGCGFFAITLTDTLGQSYWFKVNDNIAAGYQATHDVSTGQVYDAYSMSGIKIGVSDESPTQFSKNPKDIQLLVDTTWEFTYKLGSDEFVDEITFGTDTESNSDGFVALKASNKEGDIGLVFYTEFPLSLGGGYGFSVGINDDYYFFQVDDNSATGWRSSGEFYPMTGVKTKAGWVKISGSVMYEGVPLCAMVLANGQYMFSCAGDGTYEMEVPLDENGEITLFGFCDGFAPFKRISGPWAMTDSDLSMSRSGSGSMVMDITASSIPANTGWVKISGSVMYEGVPLCAMVLANGQYMFSCAGDGRYEMSVTKIGHKIYFK
ncbi:hypothetical protein QUF80_08515 [Desulfococcaceae bacterium HSG8]|nr:hypothetical protein [Desulfococcaceae bacterium HSG8]